MNGSKSGDRPQKEPGNVVNIDSILRGAEEIKEMKEYLLNIKEQYARLSSEVKWHFGNDEELTRARHKLRDSIKDLEGLIRDFENTQA